MDRGPAVTKRILRSPIRPGDEAVERHPHTDEYFTHTLLVLTLTAIYAGARLMQAGTAMFVIELTYKASLAEIDASMAAHVRFLKKYYAAGNFLISGRKIPRDGGIILAVGESRQHIDVIIREDPFYERGLADFRVIEFRASQRADDIQKRIDQ